MHVGLRFGFKKFHLEKSVAQKRLVIVAISLVMVETSLEMVVTALVVVATTMSSRCFVKATIFLFSATIATG